MSYLTYVVGCTGVESSMQITHQEFRDCEFFLGGATFTASNGFELSSACAPESFPGGCFVRGYERDDDTLELLVSGFWLREFELAVKEYNRRLIKELGPLRGLAFKPKVCEVKECTSLILCKTCRKGAVNF